MQQTKYWMKDDKQPPWGNTFEIRTGRIYKTKRKEGRKRPKIEASGDSITDDLLKKEAE